MLIRRIDCRIKSGNDEQLVMPGLVRGIPIGLAPRCRDGPDKPGHDGSYFPFAKIPDDQKS
jgi:hypothetical protein